MPSDCISYQDSGYFTPLINDYLDKKPELQSLYNRFPSLEEFKQQITEKSASFEHESRSILVSVLNRQYTNLDVSLQTKTNISALAHSNTFTVTTGHQLNLFTGPLYFLYKIVSTVNLAKQLKSAYPEYDFVPIYWMATEDHDFEEINYFNFKGRKFRWNRPAAGAVGKLDTEGLAEVFDLFAGELGSGNNADNLRQIFKNAYLDHSNLTDATRYLANELFRHTGLVVIDADNPELKALFIPSIKKEIVSGLSHQEVLKTADQLKNYNVQVNPREINLFYLDNGLRERIISEDGLYKVNNTSTVFTKDQILALADSRPEHFSPNVILRPLYQETILPNLCYIGGGGEIAYWLELKSMFKAFEVPFPILLLRNSAMLVTKKQVMKADRLNLSWADLFSKREVLSGSIVRQWSEGILQFEKLRQTLANQFAVMYDLAERTDQSFSGAVKAQEKRQMKGLDNLEKRYLKAEKRKYSDELERIFNLQNQLFPGGSLQERQVNFAEFYLQAGDELIEQLLSELQPLSNEFSVIEL